MHRALFLINKKIGSNSKEFGNLLKEIFWKKIVGKLGKDSTIFGLGISCTLLLLWIIPFNVGLQIYCLLCIFYRLRKLFYLHGWNLLGYQHYEKFTYFKMKKEFIMIFPKVMILNISSPAIVCRKSSRHFGTIALGSKIKPQS